MSHFLNEPFLLTKKINIIYFDGCYFFLCLAVNYVHFQTLSQKFCDIAEIELRFFLSQKKMSVFSNQYIKGVSYLLFQLILLYTSNDLKGRITIFQVTQTAERQIDFDVKLFFLSLPFQNV